MKTSKRIGAIEKPGQSAVLFLNFGVNHINGYSHPLILFYNPSVLFNFHEIIFVVTVQDSDDCSAITKAWQLFVSVCALLNPVVHPEVDRFVLLVRHDARGTVFHVGQLLLFFKLYPVAKHFMTNILVKVNIDSPYRPRLVYRRPTNVSVILNIPFTLLLFFTLIDKAFRLVLVVMQGVLNLVVFQLRQRVLVALGFHLLVVVAYLAVGVEGGAGLAHLLVGHEGLALEVVQVEDCS